MKWLLYGAAGLVAVLVLVVVVLLVMGERESRFIASVDVARPPDVMFTWVTEPERVKQWLGWLKEIRSVTAEQGQVGARQVWVMEDRNNNNQLMEIHAEITEYRPPSVVTARLNASEGFTGTVQYALEPIAGGGTRLHYTGLYQYEHWLARLLEPVITRAARQKLEEDLARLKQQAESDAGEMTIR